MHRRDFAGQDVTSWHWWRLLLERAIKDLCQLSDPDLFEEVAAGIGHVMESVKGLDVAACVLDEGGRH